MSEISLHGGDPSVLRRLNSAALLRALRDGGGEPTLSELAGQVGLSRPTCEGVLGDLVARGLVAEMAPRTGAGLGRPARRYRFRAAAGYALGLDIDAHRVQVLAADLYGRVRGSYRADLDVGWQPARRLDAVHEAVAACLDEAGIKTSELWAVAAGTPGVVTPEGAVAFCTVVPGWQGVDLAGELGRWFPCPVHVENDANLAVMAERWRGIARDTDDVIYVLAGLHTGMGAVIGGRVHRGRRGAAGEVGMLPELGLRDSMAALTGAAPWPSGGGAAGSEDGAGPVLVAAQHGDPEAVALVERLASRMSRGIAAMALALDPEMVVLGGPLSRSGDVLVDALRRRVRPLCLSPVAIEASTLGEEAVGLGAVRLALDRIDAHLFSLA